MKLRERPYSALRGALIANGITVERLAIRLGVGRTYMTERMTGRRSFTTEEAYQILKFIKEPPEAITAFFPPKK